MLSDLLIIRNISKIMLFFLSMCKLAFTLIKAPFRDFVVVVNFMPTVFKTVNQHL